MLRVVFCASAINCRPSSRSGRARRSPGQRTWLLAKARHSRAQLICAELRNGLPETAARSLLDKERDILLLRVEVDISSCSLSTKKGENCAISERYSGTSHHVLLWRFGRPYNRADFWSCDPPEVLTSKGSFVGLPGSSYKCREPTSFIVIVSGRSLRSLFTLRTEATPDVSMWFIRAPLPRVASAAFHRLDGREPELHGTSRLYAGAPSCSTNDTASIWESWELGPSQRSLAEGAQDHALPVDYDLMCLRHRRERGVEISAGRARNVYLLPDCLSEA